MRSAIAPQARGSARSDRFPSFSPLAHSLARAAGPGPDRGRAGALDPDEDGGAAIDTARTERELEGVQAEEDRAIRLYVSGKITERQLDHQRRLIGERLERLRAARRAPGERVRPGR